MTGDYILAVTTNMLAKLRNDDITLTLSQVKFMYYIISILLQSLVYFRVSECFQFNN